MQFIKFLILRSFPASYLFLPLNNLIRTVYPTFSARSNVTPIQNEQNYSPVYFRHQTRKTKYRVNNSSKHSPILNCN